MPFTAAQYYIPIHGSTNRPPTASPLLTSHLVVVVLVIHMSSACPGGRPLVRRKEGGGIANLVKSWMVTTGIYHRDLLQKRVLQKEKYYTFY